MKAREKDILNSSTKNYYRHSAEEHLESTLLIKIAQYNWEKVVGLRPSLSTGSEAACRFPSSTSTIYSSTLTMLKSYKDVISEIMTGMQQKRNLSLVFFAKTYEVKTKLWILSLSNSVWDPVC